MSTARLNALPRRRERHFGDRLVWCFAERAPSVWAGFERAAQAHAARTALMFENRRWSYAELLDETARLSAGLARLGVAAGDRVALQVRNRAEFVTLFYAIQRLGAVAVPMDVRLQGAEVAHVVGNSGARVLLHDADMNERAAAAQRALPDLVAVPLPEPGGQVLFAGTTCDEAAAPHVVADEEAVAMILYTSGTTGLPKGAAVTHLNVAHSFIHHAGNLGLTPDDRAVVAVPLSHVTGLVCGAIAPLWSGGTLVLLAYFKAREFLPAAAEAGMTYTIMVPAMYNLCLRVEDFDWSRLSRWRLGHFGGSPMPGATIEALAARVPGLTLVNGYGATETCSPAVMIPVGEADADLTTVGRPLACVELMVMDPDTGTEMPVGESGELWLRGPMVVAGYWNDPQATARNIVGGFWRSGDIGSVDALGNVRVHDRLKDLINRAGYKIYSAEVEAVLARCPGVLEAAIVGRPDPVLGERVHAFVTVAPGIAQDALAAFCAAHLGDYKVPESWTLMHEPLPRNATGKLSKKDLRALLAGA
ncbi:MAG: acyl--CoA ligase [Burkholderiales bacterium]|jgi:O-succinylbenzoic acid--CoA ligase|nr:acyl--CoA ligase [Burkholderiales bacterium]